MIEKISWFLAKKLIMANGDSETDYEVIEYGIECAINTIIPIFIYMVYALSNGLFLSMLVWLVTFLLLRNLTGGYHASSHIRCIVISSFYGVVSIKMIGVISHISIIPIIFSYMLLFLIHLVFNPVIHHEENKNRQYLYRTRRKIYAMLSICFISSVILNIICKPLGNAIFIGVVSAELLYLLAKPNVKNGFW